ncbi:HNH endonuclease family protein [Streptomyces sp. MB09-02B]|uniref:HNH endonuclease family protein n=1 Tax=Streptomyces sp. MB09-02B TaxID=3028667 RepID=UPI0029AABFA0|nr:HNH endonuclease family protein [Streptomyces sp. MB09-02B]MDX3646392.1 HNH endonuclease family protein [Streptomyces sp. MB09-02B]
MRRFYARRRVSILAALSGLIASAALFNAPTASAALTVATEDRTGYNRDLFNHWITISGTCNTRETVLKRDGTNVVTDSACASTSGSWYSPYDGATWTLASDLDIDHLVPLAEAWDSGADSWSSATRQAFANDLTRPQLIAVTDNVNQAKGDQDPATWMPSRTAYRCTYVRAWVQVKYYYDLSVDSAEKSALTSYLSSC